MKKLYTLAAAAVLLSMNASAAGADASKATLMFELGLVDKFGVEATVEAYNAVHPTLAMCGDKLVMNLGNGTAPVYVNAATGEKLGEIALGDADAAGSVASDDKGNMLVCNLAPGKTDFKAYIMSAVDGTPEAYIDWYNTSSLPIGKRIHILGDLRGDAVIVATCDGVKGITGSNSFVRWTVAGGVVGEPEVCKIEGVGYWSVGTGDTKVVAKSMDKADGYFMGYYTSSNYLRHINGTTLAQDMAMTFADGNSWGLANKNADCRDYNDVNYTAYMQQGIWPTWGMPGVVYLYDTTSLDKFTGDVASSPALVASLAMANMSDTYADSDNSMGDVLIVRGENAMNVYFVTNSHLGLGGYTIPADMSGVVDVVVTDAAPEYFDMQGRRVQEPTACGIYIERRGTKVTKVIK